MIQRLAITAAGIAATVVLTVGLAVAGFGPQPAQDDSAGLEAALPADLVLAADPAPQADVVYVKPAPSPRTVVVERQAASRHTSASRSSTPTRTIRNERDDDDRHEREDREDHEDRESEDDD